MKVLFFCKLLSAFLILQGVLSCAGESNEVSFEGSNPVSRLYISTSDYVSNSSSIDYFNLFIVGASDSTRMDSLANIYTSGAMGGGIVYFSPFAERIFQSGKNVSGIDTLIQAMSITLPDVIRPSGTLGNRLFKSVTGITYNSLDSRLIVANAQTDNNALYVIRNPTSGGNYRRPAFIVPLSYTPGNVVIDSLDLYVVKQDVGVVLYKGFVNNFTNRVDTIALLTPSFEGKIEGIRTIGGIAFSRRKNVLLVSDYDERGENGRILIFENFMQQIANNTLVATGTVQGRLTMLIKPTSVAIDQRAGGKYFYVADPVSKRVLRFNLTDRDNIAPDDELELRDRDVVLSPVSISLDSRGRVKEY